MKYYMDTILPYSFEEARKKVIEALREEGFGVLTEIDLQATFKKKLNVDFRKYTILGACNPHFAHHALVQEEKIGTMLPCNIILQELGARKVEVAAVDPQASMQAIDNPTLIQLAGQVKEKLQGVISSL